MARGNGEFLTNIPAYEIFRQNIVLLIIISGSKKKQEEVDKEWLFVSGSATI